MISPASEQYLVQPEEWMATKFQIRDSENWETANFGLENVLRKLWKTS